MTEGEAQLPETIEEQFEMMDELETIWRDMTLEQFSVVEDRPIALVPFVYAYSAQVMELARATMVLARAEQTYAAVPLVRSALEFAATAAWLVVEPLTDDLIWHGARKRKATLEAFLEDKAADLTEVIDEHTLALVAREGQPDRAARVLEERCKRLKGGAKLYATYRALSGYCHAETFAAERWLSADNSGGPLPFKLRRRPLPADPRSVVGTMLTMMLLALNAARVIKPSDERDAKIVAIARRLGVTDSIRLVD